MELIALLEEMNMLDREIARLDRVVASGKAALAEHIRLEAARRMRASVHRALPTRIPGADTAWSRAQLRGDREDPRVTAFWRRRWAADSQAVR
jgi:hypothetical protein